MVKRQPPGHGKEPPGGRARSRLEQFEFMHGRELDDVDDDVDEPSPTDNDQDDQRTDTNDEPQQRPEPEPSSKFEHADD